MYPDEDLPANCILSNFDVNRLLEEKQDPIRANPDFSAFPGDFIKEGIIRRTRENRGQAAKVRKGRGLRWYYAEINGYLLMSDKGCSLIKHDTLNLTP